MLILPKHYVTININKYLHTISLAKVLSALGMNLKNKSDTYHDQHLAAIFMLNNYNYIQQKLETEQLLEVIHQYDPAVGSYYATQTAQQKTRYFESFAPILDILSEKSTLRVRSAGEKVVILIVMLAISLLNGVICTSVRI